MSHNMNVLQLAEKYQKDTREHGDDKALKLLKATGISGALAVEIGLCFDAQGNAVDFNMKQKEYTFK